MKKLAVWISVKLEQIRAFGQIIRHFHNPILVIGLRLGLIKLPYFSYGISKDQFTYYMLARPATTSLADLFVLREVMIEEVYAPVLKFLPGNNSIRAVDIGANLGSFTVWLHQRAGVREVYCFEPEPDSYRLLAMNLANNGCDFAKTFACAVGGENRSAQIALKKTSPGGTSIYAAKQEGLPGSNSIQVMAFENWLRDTGGDFDLLKMDCEGAEWEIMDQTEPSEWKRFRIVIAEIHEDGSKRGSVQYEVNDFPKLMEQRGFRTIHWDGHSHGLYLGERIASS